MASDLFQALRTAHSGLIANQQALDVVARNVSNANTPGYSRRIVNLEQRTLAGFGAGVQFGTLTRNLDHGLLASLRLESGRQQASAAANDILTRVQDLFGQPESNTSLAHQLAGFQGAVESLALAPQDTLNRREVVQTAQDLAASLRDASAAVQNLRREADTRIGDGVQEINSLLQSVAELNDKIVRNRAVGQDVVDLEDNRDQKLDRQRWRRRRLHRRRAHADRRACRTPEPHGGRHHGCIDRPGVGLYRRHLDRRSQSRQ